MSRTGKTIRRWISQLLWSTAEGAWEGDRDEGERVMFVKHFVSFLRSGQSSVEMSGTLKLLTIARQANDV